MEGRQEEEEKCAGRQCGLMDHWTETENDQDKEEEEEAKLQTVILGKRCNLPLHI